MGDFIRWIASISVRIGFWAGVIFTFLPVLTLILSGILISLDDTVIKDLYYMVQLWLPFNLNVVLLWCMTLAMAFGAFWIARKAEAYANKLLSGRADF